ncbi:MAG: DUF3791 domain-containing protein [Bacillales bacterium]|jgi:uncharacterized protein YbaA (DUF1428 family)|nr:DUF3791 domain-containing protein [Bacillales bacterium]
MKKILEFKMFCIENYKSTYKMTGKEVAELFEKYGVLNYINTFYDDLHCYGSEYIINDLKAYIKARK